MRQLLLGALVACGGPPTPEQRLADAESACAEGDAVACRRAVGALRAGDGVAADARGAQAPSGRIRAALEAGCTAGDGDLCHQRGMMHLTGIGVPADLTLAATWFERGCEHGHAPACTDAGLVAEREGLPTAEGLVVAGCDGGDGRACTKLGLMSGGDLDQAVPWFDRGCTLGWAAGCGLLASVFAPPGPRPDPARHHAALGRGVALGDAIAVSGWLAGVTLAEVDEAEARAALACAAATPFDPAASIADREAATTTRLGHCAVAGRLAAAKGDVATAVNRLGPACPGEPRACGVLADLAEAMPEDVAAAGEARTVVELRGAACLGGDATACVAWGDAALSGEHTEGPDLPEAVRAYRRACEARIEAGCARLAALDVPGLAAPR